MMRRHPCVLIALSLPVPATALDFNDFDAVCQATAAATTPDDPAAFHTVCTCAYGVIAAELGPDFARTYARFELADAPLEEMLPATMTSDMFFAQIGEIGPAIDAACAS